jgi:putative ABC transport system ATP-binding protein
LLLELEAVRREYVVGSDVVRALRGVDLGIEAGEFVALMGPSGSGKSTLLNILGGLDQPSSGSYRLEGRDVSSLNDDDLSALRRERIGFVFQGFQLLPRASALRNVELPLVYAGEPRERRRERAAATLERVGLGDRMEHRPSELSGGQRQRVAIARAIIHRPAILLADEPTGNLDTAAGDAILALLDELHAEGHTILLVTHEEERARRAQRILRMRDGLLESDERRDGREIQDKLAPS